MDRATERADDADETPADPHPHLDESEDSAERDPAGTSARTLDANGDQLEELAEPGPPGPINRTPDDLDQSRSLRMEEAEIGQRPPPESDQVRPGTVGPDGIRRFTTDADGEAYGEQVLGTTYDQLDPSAQKAVYEYTRESDPYNHVLRALSAGNDPQEALDQVLGDPWRRERVIASFDGRLPGLPDIYERISDIDRAIDSPLPEAIEVIRGIRTVEHMSGFRGKVWNLDRTVQCDAAFTSASLGKDAAFGPPTHPIQLHLRLPAGAKGLWIGQNSRYPNEREVVLPRGLRYMITEIVEEQDGIWHLYCELQDQEPSPADEEQVQHERKGTPGGNSYLGGEE